MCALTTRPAPSNRLRRRPPSRTQGFDNQYLAPSAGPVGPTSALPSFLLRSYASGDSRVNADSGDYKAFASTHPLLRETASSIEDIAGLLAYSGASAFNRAFAHWGGVHR